MSRILRKVRFGLELIGFVLMAGSGPMASLPAEAQVLGTAPVYTCEASAATLQPPMPAPPVVHQIGSSEIPAGEARRSAAVGEKMSALCPEGQLPRPMARKAGYFHKGNPRLKAYEAPGPEHALPKEFVKQHLLRPVDDLFAKDELLAKDTSVAGPDSAAGAELAAQATCNGSAYYNSCYYYANAPESETADGGGMSLEIELPVDVETGGSGGHSIGELAVEGSSASLTDVEMGFNVALNQYGDNKVHLFIYHWVDGAETCYDACAWNQYSNTYYPGMDISAFAGQQVYLGWIHSGGAWWAWFNDQWLGYILDTEWSNTFTQSVLIQWYGEVATSNGVPPMTQMGNGQFPSSTTAATMATLCQADATAWQCNYDDKQSSSATFSSYYNVVNHSSFGAIRYGGPGQAGVTAPLVTVTPGFTSVSQALPLTVTVTVASGNAKPTGTVTLTSGSYASSATALTSGSVSFTIPAGSLPAGQAALTATYVPDQAGALSYESARGAAAVTVTGLPAPVFSPPGGQFVASQLVSIQDSSAGAAIYYTTDGSLPTSASTKYTGAIEVSQTETINAIAVETGFSNSAVASATYTITTAGAAGLRFVPVTPCRVADTRGPSGPFGGPKLAAGSTREFNIPASACGIPSTALAFSLNVTVAPDAELSYLTLWPSGLAQPNVSTLNSDGRIKADAAIVPAGNNGGVSIYVTDATQVILDIDGYFVPAAEAAALEFFPVTPCRAADTRQAAGPLGAPSLAAGASRAFPVLSSACNLPSAARAYSLNVTAVPHNKLNYLTAWNTGGAQPNVSTLNSSTGAITANAAIVPAGTGGEISIFVSDAADVILDVNGYFAPPATGGLSLYTATPCRVLDTRSSSGAFNGKLPAQVADGGADGYQCPVSAQASDYVLNATVVPSGPLNYLTLWADGGAQPYISTLNADDGAITSNLAIVPSTNGSVEAFSSNSTQLILDVMGYFAP